MSDALLSKEILRERQGPKRLKALRTIDIIKGAINDGKPLPLQVMLEAMWDFRDKKVQAEADGRAMDAVAYTGKMLDAAATAAPYCHPKLGAVPADQGLDPEGGRALSAHAILEALRGKSVGDLNRAYLDAVAGRLPEQVVYDESDHGTSGGADGEDDPGSTSPSGPDTTDGARPSDR